MEVTSSLDENRLPTALEKVCFRVVQECVVTKAMLRHARPSHKLGRTGPRRRTRFCVTVRDDRVGFDVTAAAKRERGVRGEGFGLLFSMIGAASNSFGGRIEIESARPGCRTTDSKPLPPVRVS